jgi:hypothetical protein
MRFLVSGYIGRQTREMQRSPRCRNFVAKAVLLHVASGLPCGKYLETDLGVDGMIRASYWRGNLGTFTVCKHGQEYDMLNT